MARRSSSKEDEGCGLLVVGAIVAAILVAAIQAAVRWLGEGYHLTWITAIVGLLVVVVYAGSWRRAPQESTPPPAGAGAAALPVTTAGTGPLLVLLALVAAVSIYSFTESAVAGILALTIGGFGVSFIGWSWWRPLHLRLGPRLHFPWWWRISRPMASTVGAAAIVTLALTGIAAGVAANRLQDRRDSGTRQLEAARESASNRNFGAAARHLRAASSDGASSGDIAATREKVRDERTEGRAERRTRRIRSLTQQARSNIPQGDFYAVEEAIRQLRNADAFGPAQRLGAAARDAWIAKARRSMRRGDYLGASDLAQQAVEVARAGLASTDSAQRLKRSADAEYDQQLELELEEYEGGGGGGGSFDIPGIPGT